MVYDKVIDLPEERVFFDSELLKKGKPSYLFERNGHRQHRRLPWPNDIRIDYVASATLDDKSLVLLATTPDRLLRLFYFDRNKFVPPESVVVGRPTYIYDFPGASNVIAAAGRYWLAWVCGNRDNNACETILSSWRPGEEKPRERVLNAPAGWNTSISIAAIGDRLCIAYHCQVTNDYPGKGELVTVFTEAK